MSSDPPPDPDSMVLDSPAQTEPKLKPATNSRPTPTSKTRTLAATTLKNPPFAYAHLAVASQSREPSPHEEDTPLDALQVRAYLTAALRQFLGDTGVAIPIDILLIEPRSSSVWVRVPRADLPAFAAGITAFAGLSPRVPGGGGGKTLLLQLKACGDWLGSLIGREEQGGLWTF